MTRTRIETALRACLAAPLSLGLGLMASAAIPNYRVANPPSISATGNGWVVDPVTRSLTAVFPAQVLPGDMPVPLSVRMKGSFSRQEGQAYFLNTETFQMEWQPVATEFPAYASVHFGYIAGQVTCGQAVLPPTYVLESGRTYTDSDFSSGNPLSLLSPFGLAATPTYSSPRTSNDLAVATYTANASDLGSLAGKVAAVNPVGFGTAPTTWTVVVTAQRARVYAYLTEFNAWAPVLWADKFGHTVTFQWTKGTTSLPSGVSAVYSVRVLNVNPSLSPSQYKGILVQWAAGPVNGLVNDVLRADFINVDAPSLRVQGLSGAGGMPVYSEGFTVNNLTRPNLPGPVFLPTTVTVGAQNQLPTPVWMGAGQALPTMVAGTPGQNLTPQTWTIGWTYDGALTSITEPAGLTTAFTHELGTLGLPFTPTGSSTYEPGQMDFYGIRTAVSTDALNGSTRTQSWVQDSSNPAEVALVHQDFFGSAPVKENRTVFCSSGQTGGNSAVLYSVIRDPVTQAVAKRVDYTYTTAGTDGTLTPWLTATTTYPDGTAPPAKVTRTYAQSGLQVTSEALTAGASFVPVQTTANTFTYLPAYLEPARPVSTTVTRFDPAGTALPLTRTVTTQYDNDAPGGPGLVTRQALSGGALGDVGQVVSFNGEGRARSIASYNSTASTPVASKALTYDPATGSMATETTTYSTALGGTATAVVTGTVNTFDSLGRATQVTDPRGVVTTSTYDTLGRMMSRTVTGVPNVTYSYASDFCTVTQTQAGASSVTVSDRFGRVLATTAANGTRTQVGYDAAGRRAWSKAIAGDGTAQVPATWTYDLLDRVVQSVNPGGAGATLSRSYAISPRNGTWSRTVTTLDPGGIHAAQVVDVNAAGQATWSQDAAGATTAITYDGLGNQVAVQTTDTVTGKVQNRTFTFDRLSRLTQKTEPETGTTTFSNFDALNHATTVTEANGRARQWTFDGLGRQISHANGGDSQSWTYTGLNLTTTTSIASNGTVTQSFKYEGPGGCLSEEDTLQPGWSSAITYTFDDRARLDTVKYPSGRLVKYGYDVINRVTSITNNGASLVSNVAYSAWGPRQRITFGSTAWSDWATKDGGTHLDTWTFGYVAGGTVGDYTANPRVYQYDSAERLVRAAEWTTLTQDAKGRLTSAAAPDVSLSSGIFSHDGFDNNTSSAYGGASSVPLTSFTIDPGATNLTPTYDTKGVMTGWTYGSPSNGEAQSVGITLGSSPQLGLTWDGLGRLRSVYNGQNGNTESFLYAASGLRVALNDSSDYRYYAYASSGSLMEEYNPSTGIRDMVYLGGTAVAEIDASGVHELHVDHLGTPRVITQGSTGRIEGVLNFGAFGEYLAGASGGYRPVTGYTGHVMAPRLIQEPYGLIYMKGRYYSPVWHRFVNSDRGADSKQASQVAYGGGNPVVCTDPTGLYYTPISSIIKWYSMLTLNLEGGSSGGAASLPAGFITGVGSNGSVASAGTLGADPSGIDLSSLPENALELIARSIPLTGTVEVSRGQGVDPKGKWYDVYLPWGKTGSWGSVGFGVGGSAELVVGGPMAAWNGSRVVYNCGNGQTAIVNSIGKSNIASAYKNGDWGFAADVGAGVVFSYSNATTPAQFNGDSRVTSVTVGFVQLQFSSSSSGLFGFSLGVSKGWGAGVSSYGYTSTAYVYGPDGNGNLVPQRVP